jgi:hypothetical protein
MLHLLTTNVDTTSRTITTAVDVEFEKDGSKHEANVTCVYNQDTNIGYDDWDCLIANEGDLPELTLDEENQILDHAQKYAETLVG